MKWLALAIAAMAIAGTATASEGKLASEQDFARLLTGCWGGEWWAEFTDGTSATGTDTACFENGRVSTRGSVRGDEAAGHYWLADQKLYLQADQGSEGWLLQGASMTCDATVRPDEALTLSGCTGRRVRADGSLGPVETLADSYFTAVKDAR